MLVWLCALASQANSWMTFDIFALTQFARAGDLIVNVSFPRQTAESEAQAAEFKKARGCQRPRDITAAADTDDQGMF